MIIAAAAGTPTCASIISGTAPRAAISPTGTVGRWAEDAIAAIDSLTEGPQVLVGSSLGGWIMLLAARARPQRIHALVGIAAAPDFTADLIWPRLTRRSSARSGTRASSRCRREYHPAGYTYRLGFFEEAERHLLLREPIALACPVRLLHGLGDARCRGRRSLDIAARLESRDVTVTLVKDGDHRLSTRADLARLAQTLDALLAPS